MTGSGYYPKAFDAEDEAAARAIILTAEGESTESRWERETPYLAQRLIELLDLRAGDKVVDFGCGIGRVARELIARIDCEVLGVDISPRMREMAAGYVASERFRAVGIEEFDSMCASGWRAYGAYTCWVLQHCNDPRKEIARVVNALPPHACLAVLNSAYAQALPTKDGWDLREIDMRAILQETLVELNAEKLPADVAASGVLDTTFFGLYRNGSAPARTAASSSTSKTGPLAAKLKRWRGKA